MCDKTKIRLKSKKLREKLNITEISNLIITKLISLDIYETAQNIMLFYPKNNEINLLDVLNKNKNFFLPRVHNNSLECCPYRKGDMLKKSEFNIYEPLTDAIDKQSMDIICVPALAADDNGHRIGYGGGYYDKFLKDFKGYKIIVIPEELKYFSLPYTSNDVICDIVITQKKASFIRG